MSLNEAEVAALKVGDEVGIGGYGTYVSYSVRTVEKRTATQVTVAGERFNKRGNKIGGRSRFSATYLISVEEARERIAAQRATLARNQARNALREFSYSALSDEQLFSVRDLLNSFAKPEPK